MLYIAGIVIVICTICVYLVRNPSVIRYFIWKTEYFFYNTAYKIFPCEYFKAIRRKHCDRQVLVSWIKLWYMENDKKLPIPWIAGLYLSEIWLSHGPTYNQSMNLKENFEGKATKPTLFIGRLVFYTKKDREGLELLKNYGFELKIWKQESDKVHEKYASHLEKYILQLENKEIESKVTISYAELNVTHAVSNRGKMHRSAYNAHAEIVLIKDKPQNVQEIWIDNSPCEECSLKLVEYFKCEKPTIYVGKIYTKDPDGIGMGLLVKKGFSLEPWEEYIKYTGRWNVKNTKIARKINNLKKDN